MELHNLREEQIFRVIWINLLSKAEKKKSHLGRLLKNTREGGSYNVWQEAVEWQSKKMACSFSF